jgi:glutathione peroxidase
MSIYDFSVLDAQDQTVSLSQYKGKVLLVVNTATKCGFTPQYTGLQELYDKYKAEDFELLDFPCNQFGSQAPGTNQEIGSFCTLNYHTTFPRFAKIEVNGPQEAPLYTWLKAQKGGIGGANIKWNFTKFLIDKNGEVIARFASTKTPAALEAAVAGALAGSAKEDGRGDA